MLSPTHSVCFRTCALDYGARSQRDLPSSFVGRALPLPLYDHTNTTGDKRGGVSQASSMQSEPIVPVSVSFSFTVAGTFGIMVIYLRMDRSWSEQKSPEGRADSAPLLVARQLVVAGLLISALIHVALAPEHLRHAPLLGIGFLAVAALQCAFGVIFSRRPGDSRRLKYPGATAETPRTPRTNKNGKLGIVAGSLTWDTFFGASPPASHLWSTALVLLAFSLTTYVISRTLGLPFDHDHPSESMLVIDVVANGSELVALGGLLASIHITTRNWPRGRSVRLAPFNRYAYLLALMLMGVIAALLLVHTGGHHSP